MTPNYILCRTCFWLEEAAGIFMMDDFGNSINITNKERLPQFLFSTAA